MGGKKNTTVNMTSKSFVVCDVTGVTGGTVHQIQQNYNTQSALLPPVQEPLSKDSDRGGTEIMFRDTDFPQSVKVVQS